MYLQIAEGGNADEADKGGNADEDDKDGRGGHGVDMNREEPKPVPGPQQRKERSKGSIYLAMVGPELSSGAYRVALEGNMTRRHNAKEIAQQTPEPSPYSAPSLATPQPQRTQQPKARALKPKPGPLSASG